MERLPYEVVMSLATRRRTRGGAKDVSTLLICSLLDMVVGVGNKLLKSSVICFSS